LGRIVVDAALRAQHQVRTFVRDPKGAALPADVAVVVGDARRADEIQNALAGTDVAFFCVNPRFSRWAEEFPPLLEAAILACRATAARLVFPANVWVYGPGSPHAVVDERRPLSPTSKRGILRARMETNIKTSGARYTLVRLPELYGPHVVSLTARIFQSVLRHKPVLWPGPLDIEVELVYIADGAKAMVEAGCADGVDGETFHISGGRTTPRRFIDTVCAATGIFPRVTDVPKLALRIAGAFNSTIRGAADIAHLWTDPILLDGRKYAARFGDVPQTPYEVGVRETLDWHRANPNLVLQG
jgi:nucleoside-diphosphate-sugar epimerase